MSLGYHLEIQIPQLPWREKVNPLNILVNPTLFLVDPWLYPLVINDAFQPFVFDLRSLK